MPHLPLCLLVLVLVLVLLLVLLLVVMVLGRLLAGGLLTDVVPG